MEPRVGATALSGRKHSLVVLTWRDIIKDYHKQEKITLCPTATRLHTDGARPPFGAWEQTWNAGQVGVDSRPIASSYGINQWVLNTPTRYGAILPEKRSDRPLIA